MKSQRKFIQTAGIVLLISFSSSALLAAGIADEQISGSDLSLSPTVAYDVATLRVSSDAADVTNAFQSGESISMDLSSMTDGLYNYELSLVTNSAEAEGSGNTGTRVGQGGQFRIINGSASVYNESVAEDEAAIEAEALIAEQQAVNNAASDID